ncbi:MAG: hypothetical protein K0U41_09600 [Gammaproteobacteria bacterium]|nr:hypothetical protein [Gammaproteobacteria bacterium]
MSDITEALILAGVGFGFVFFFLGCLVISLIISSRIFGLINRDTEESELPVAAVSAAIKHHRKNNK